MGYGAISDREQRRLLDWRFVPRNVSSAIILCSWSSPLRMISLHHRCFSILREGNHLCLRRKREGNSSDSRRSLPASRSVRPASAGWTRSPAAACRAGGPRWSAAAPAAARRCWPWNSSSAASATIGEPGVFMAFEETTDELTKNVASLGFDLDEPDPPQEAGARLRLHRAKRDRGDRRIRPGRAVRPPGQHDRGGRRQARRASTRSRRSSPACPTRPSCGRSCAGSSAGSKTGTSPPSSPANRARRPSPATAWRNTSATA